MPDMALVGCNVWVGGWSAARDHGHEFEVVVNVAHDSPITAVGARGFHMVDGPGNPKECMDAAVAFVADCIRAKKKTLVHCHGGRSRSVVVVAAALRIVHGIPLEQTIERIRPIRGLGADQPHAALLALV